MRKQGNVIYVDFERRALERPLEEQLPPQYWQENQDWVLEELGFTEPKRWVSSLFLGLILLACIVGIGLFIWMLHVEASHLGNAPIDVSYGIVCATNYFTR